MSAINDEPYIGLRIVAELQAEEIAREGVAPEYLESVADFDRRKEREKAREL